MGINNIRIIIKIIIFEQVFVQLNDILNKLCWINLSDKSEYDRITVSFRDRFALLLITVGTWNYTYTYTCPAVCTANV